MYPGSQSWQVARMGIADMTRFASRGIYVSGGVNDVLKIPNHRHRRSLRPRRERPRRRAAQPRDEFPPSHPRSSQLVCAAYIGPGCVGTGSSAASLKLAARSLRLRQVVQEVRRTFPALVDGLTGAADCSVTHGPMWSIYSLHCELRHTPRSSAALRSARPDHKERCHVRRASFRRTSE
jgi:hypothetical protein